MTYCAVKGCHNSSHNHEKRLKIPFHGFPSDPTIAARWIEKIRLNRKENYWKPTKHTKICSMHFDEKEKYITKGGLSKLRHGAIPTKGLHIFCTEDSNDVCNNIHDPLKLDKPPLGASSNDANENANFETPTILLSPSRQQQIISNNEAHASNEPVRNNDQIISQESDMDLESIFDTPRKSVLRRQLAKKISLQRKHSKKIKTLQQKARRLKKKTLCLQKILVNLRKKRFIDNDKILNK